MLKISRTEKKFCRLDTPTLTAASILERADLQEYIANSPEAFFTELGEPLFILAKEVLPSDAVQDRIDLLAVDKQGRVAVIELKRGNDKLQMLQAIAYAGMVSKWTYEQVLSRAGARADALTGFIDVETNEINWSQRIVLVAEAYDFEVLAGAEWLYEQYDVNILCARVALAVDPATSAEYLVCNQIFPTKELADHAIPRRRTVAVSTPKWASWDELLADIENAATVDFFRRRLASGQKGLLRKSVLYFNEDGEQRWLVSCNPRKKEAYLWQSGRFEGDVEFWRERLTRPDKVGPDRNGTCLHADLSTESDFAAFESAVDQKPVPSRVWLSSQPEEDSVRGSEVIA